MEYVVAHEVRSGTCDCLSMFPALNETLVSRIGVAVSDSCPLCEAGDSPVALYLTHPRLYCRVAVLAESWLAATQDCQRGEVDITNPARPVTLRALPLSSGREVTVSADGNLVVVAAGDAGLWRLGPEAGFRLILPWLEVR